jgi:N-methylhydantoinase A
VLRIGVDIGGTFTDLVLLHADGRVVTRKIPSSPDDHSRAIVEALADLLTELRLEPSSVRELVHGTTIATNAIVEQRGAPTGLLTTRGFRDTLEIGRLRYPRLYDLTWSKPVPLVERRWRREVPERLDREGRVVLPLDEPAAREAIGRLRDAGAESIAVCLLHSFVNPIHERRLGELIAEQAPGVAVALSSDVLPEIGEYERTSTTVINAYVQPVVGGYLRQLEARLAQLGISAPVLVMQSSGGIMSGRAASLRPIHIVESGPAAGVIAAQRVARALDSPNVITLDMGGTTAKAAILEGGEPRQVSEYEVGGGLNIGNRLNRGAGYLLRAPAIDIAEVGAGGGSLVWLDAAGALHCGPRSAGAIPGPVCYRTGGTQPTLTDANLLLGYLNPCALLGGSLTIDIDFAREVFSAQIAQPLALTVEEAAYGVHRIGVANMVRVVKAVSSERGRDPRTFSLVAFGGNGPVHAALVAAELSMRRVIVPPWPGLFSAFGLLGAELTHHFSRTLLRPTDILQPGDVEQVFHDLEDVARATLADEGYVDGACHLVRSVDARYVGQSFELRLALDGGAFTQATLASLERRFGDEHERTYGHRADTDPIELVNLRVAATGLGDSPRGSRAVRSGDRSASGPGNRPAYFGPRHGTLDTRVLGRADVTTEPLRGPVIVEEYDTTTIVPPSCAVWRDPSDNLVIEVNQAW